MKVYVATPMVPGAWRAYEATAARRAQGFGAPQATQKVRVYQAIHEAGPNGISRQAICDQTGFKPHTVSFYLSKFKLAGNIDLLINGVSQAHVAAAAKAPGGVTANMSFEDALLASMAALENTLVIKARARGITDDMRKHFIIYQKAKSHVLSPTENPHEKDAAIKLALKRLIEAVF